MKKSLILLLLLSSFNAIAHDYCVIGNKTTATSLLSEKANVNYQCKTYKDKYLVFSVSALQGLTKSTIYQAQEAVGQTVIGTAILVGDISESTDPEIIELITYEIRDVADLMSGISGENSVLILEQNKHSFIQELQTQEKKSIKLKKFDAEGLLEYLNGF